MPRFRPLAAILLALLAARATAQQAKPAPAPRRESRRRLRLPATSSLQGRREDASERAEGHRRPDRVPEHRVGPDPRSDGLAERGRARQVRLRPLLRAHDVPRHEGLPAREVPGHRDALGRRRQNAYTTDDYTNYHTTFPKEDLETIARRSRPTASRTSRTPSRRSRPRRGAVLGEYNKNSANPIPKLYEVLRDNAFSVHTYKHTTMGFLKDIEDMPNQYEYSQDVLRPLVPARVRDDDRRRRREARGGLPPRREVLGRMEARRSRVTVPRGASRERARVRPRSLADRHAARGSSSAFHGPAFSETKKDLPAIDTLFDLSFGPTSDLYKSLVEQEQKLDALLPSVGITEDPRARHGVLARLKKGTDPVVRPRRDPAARSRPCASKPVDEKRLAEVKSQRALRPRRGARRHGDDRRAPRALREAPPVVRNDQHVLPPRRRAHARRPPGGGADVPDGREPRPDDALEGCRCPTRSRTLPALATFAAASQVGRGAGPAFRHHPDVARFRASR